MITDESLMAEWEKAVMAMSIQDYGPDDAVFTSRYGVSILPLPTAMGKRRSPLQLLHDYSAAFKEHGVSPPDLVFQTYRGGREFFYACLSDAGTKTAIGIETGTDRVDGMYIARVMGVNLIWPEK